MFVVGDQMKKKTCYHRYIHPLIMNYHRNPSLMNYISSAPIVTYRVFKKEGEKVKGYYTTKKLILGAVWGFIVTVRRMGHLINCIKLPKNFTFKLKIRPSNI